MDNVYYVEPNIPNMKRFFEIDNICKKMYINYIKINAGKYSFNNKYFSASLK